MRMYVYLFSPHPLARRTSIYISLYLCVHDIVSLLLFLSLFVLLE